MPRIVTAAKHEAQRYGRFLYREYPYREMLYREYILGICCIGKAIGKVSGSELPRH